MRVLFLSDHFVTPDQPGVLRTWQLTRYLCEQGDAVTVVAPSAYFPFARTATGDGRRDDHPAESAGSRGPCRTDHDARDGG